MCARLSRPTASTAFRLQSDCGRRDVRDGTERGHSANETECAAGTEAAVVVAHVQGPEGRPAGPVVRVPGHELLGRQQGLVPRPVDVGRGDRGGHHIPGGQGRHRLRVRHAVLDDVHRAGHHPVDGHALGLRGPVPGAQAVSQRQPDDRVGLHAGHGVQRRCRVVRDVQHNGGRRGRGHLGARQLGTERGHHAGRRQRAATRAGGRPELADGRDVQKEFLVQAPIVHQTGATGIPAVDPTHQ